MNYALFVNSLLTLFKFKNRDYHPEEDASFVEAYKGLATCFQYVKDHMFEMASSNIIAESWLKKAETVVSPYPLSLQNGSKFVKDVIKVCSKMIN